MKSIFGTLILGMALLMVGCATPNFTSAEMRDRWTAITGDPISDEDIFSLGVVVQKWPILGEDEHGNPIWGDHVIHTGFCRYESRCQLFVSRDNLVAALFNDQTGGWEIGMMVPISSIEVVYTRPEPFKGWLDDLIVFATKDSEAGGFFYTIKSAKKSEWNEKLEPFLREQMQFKPAAEPTVVCGGVDVEQCQEALKWSREEVSESVTLEAF